MGKRTGINEKNLLQINAEDLDMYSDPARIRTWDLQIRSLLLYPAELRGQSFFYNRINLVSFDKEQIRIAKLVLNMIIKG